MRATVIVARADDLDCGDKVLRDAAFPGESKTKRRRGVPYRRTPSGFGPISYATGMTRHVLTKHTIHARLPTFTGGLEVGNDLGAVAY